MYEQYRRIHINRQKYMKYSHDQLTIHRTQKIKGTLIVRSGGRAQVRELCLEDRFLAERLPASRSTEPNLRARSMRRDWLGSSGADSRRRSKERSTESELVSARSRNVWRRLSIWREGSAVVVVVVAAADEEAKGQGRLAMEDGLWRRVWVSIAGGYERREGEVTRKFGGRWCTDVDSSDTCGRTCLSLPYSSSRPVFSIQHQNHPCVRLTYLINADNINWKNDLFY